MGEVKEEIDNFKDILSLNDLFNNILSVEPDIDGDSFIFNKNELYVKIDVDADNFHTIDVKNGDTQYYYEFNNISKVDKLNY